MGKCKLCLEREANKKGSHVIPHFLVKSMVNDDRGENERDKEISFKMEATFSDVYFGRRVLPEKVEEILGRIRMKRYKLIKTIMLKIIFYVNTVKKGFQL